MSMDFVLQLLIGFGGAAGVYAAIKADLAKAIITAERAEKDAGEAYTRLNSHIDLHHSRG